jgi:hypothetical protein
VGPPELDDDPLDELPEGDPLDDELPEGDPLDDELPEGDPPPTSPDEDVRESVDEVDAPAPVTAPP